jgi:hypothetical protein
MSFLLLSKKFQQIFASIQFLYVFKYGHTYCAEILEQSTGDLGTELEQGLRTGPPRI